MIRIETDRVDRNEAVAAELLSIGKRARTLGRELKTLVEAERTDSRSAVKVVLRAFAREGLLDLDFLNAAASAVHAQDLRRTKRAPPINLRRSQQ